MNRDLIAKFIAMGIGVCVITVDLAAINVALPAIEKSFKTNIDTIQWAINGYALSFAVLMVTCGRLADMFGRRKIFFIGLFIISIASIIGGFANSSGLLIGARVLQGIGAAFLWPAILGIVYSSVRDEQKGLAVGLILGAAGVGNAAGPLVGGFLTEIISWRAVLFVNVPLALIAGVITWFKVKEQYAGTGEKKIDYWGIITVSISLVAFLYGLDQSMAWGWGSYKTILLFAIFILFFLIFVKVEHTTPSALIPKDVMTNAAFMLTCSIMFTVIPAFFAILLYLPQYLEKFQQFSSFGAGAALVPMLLTFAIMAPISGKIYNMIGPKRLIFIGMLGTCFGTLFVITLGFDDNYWNMLPGLIMIGIGLGLSVPSITTAAVGRVKASRTSLAGGIIYMFQLAGGALGLAIITTIFTDVAINDITQRLGDMTNLSLTTAEHAAILTAMLGSSSLETMLNGFDNSTIQQIAPHIQHAFVMGIKIGLGFAAALAAVGAIVTLFVVDAKSSQQTKT